MADKPLNEARQARAAVEVINQAIRENRPAEIVLLALAAIVVITGVIVLLYSLVSGQAITAIAGAISSTMFIPAMSYAKKIRKENIAIRLLELPLDRADTAKEAAETIREAYMKLNSEEANQVRGKKKD